MASYKMVMITGLIVGILGVLLLTSNMIHYEDATRTFMELAIKLVIVALGYLIYKKRERVSPWRFDPNAILHLASSATLPQDQVARSHYLQSSSSVAATSTPPLSKAGQGLDIFVTDQERANSLAIFNRTRLLLLGQLNSRGMGISRIKVNSTSESSSVFEADIHPAGDVFLARGRGAESLDASPESAKPSVRLILTGLQIPSDAVSSMLREMSSNLQKEFEYIVVRESFGSINVARDTLQYKAAPQQTGLRKPSIEAPRSQDQRGGRGENLLKSTFSFDGRVRRITFWINFVILFPISFLLNHLYVHRYVSLYDFQEHTYITNKPVYFTAMAVIGIRVLSISVRRWHDLEKSGWLAALTLFVIASNSTLIDLSDTLYWSTLFLSAVFSLVILGFQGFVPGDEGSNEYGPAPEEGQLW